MKHKKMSNLRAILQISKVVGPLKIVMMLAILTGTFGFLCAIGVTILGGFGLSLNPYMLDGTTVISPNNSLLSNQNLIILSCATVLIGFLRGLLRYVEQYANHYIAFKILAKIRSNTYAKLEELAPNKLEQKQKGDLIAALTADIETLEVFYAHTISPFFISILTCSGIAILLGFVASWHYVLLYLGSVLIIGFIVPLIFNPSLNKLGQNYRGTFAKFNAFFYQSLKGLREITAYNYTQEQIKQLHQQSTNLTILNNQINSRNHQLFGITAIIISLSIIASLVLSYFLKSKISSFQMLNGIIIIFAGFGPVLPLSNLPSTLNQTFAATRRIAQILQEKPTIPAITSGNNFIFNNLKVRNVSFGYNLENTILKDINFEVKKGEIISLIGESGCGKSTILKMLMRFISPSTGDILYNNNPINNINTNSLYDNVALVSQNTYLFNTTIYDNVIMGYEQIKSKDDVILACQKAGIHDFIMSLPNNYDTTMKIVNENISAGEKQRLGLARAFLKNAPLILLDEPTSNVDALNEKIILSSILKEKENYAVIIISHRQSTVDIADRRYYFKNGTITTNE